ncbi:hypothetical protein [Lysobacter gummosus]|uniref:hypothetical protein n=1 Tax=Lysobacter gummosus TaxID=262324 RepID=UPI00363F9CFE
MKGRACEPQVRAALNAHRLCLWAGGPGGFAFDLPASPKQIPRRRWLPAPSTTQAPAPFQRGRIVWVGDTKASLHWPLPGTPNVCAIGRHRGH